MVNPFPRKHYGGSPLGDDVPPDGRFGQVDESEGEFQARQFFRLPGRMGGKSLAAEMMLEEFLRRAPNSRVGLVSTVGTAIVNGNDEIDCVVVKLHRETERAMLLELSFSLEEDEIQEHIWWLPKSQFMVTGDSMRIKRWILEKRIQEGKLGHTIAENLLRNHPVKG